MTSECPLWIAAEDRAFLEDKSHEDILRVSDVSQENLEEIVRRGEPVIVTDALRGRTGSLFLFSLNMANLSTFNLITKTGVLQNVHFELNLRGVMVRRG